MSALNRLRGLVENIEDIRDNGKPIEMATGAWQTYLRDAAADAADLAANPQYPALLGRLREGGKGWPTRVGTIERMVKTAERTIAPQIVGPDGDSTAEGFVVDMLAKNRDGHINKTVRNAILILTHDSRWHGRIRKNAFTTEVEIDGVPLQDEDGTGAMVWLDENYGVVLPTPRVEEAIRYIATEHQYHPVRDYLTGLEWDGRERAKVLLGEYMGADPEGKSALLPVISVRFLVSCVARVMEPGCKVDTVLVLQGKQGGGKSTALEALASPEFFGDSEIDPKNKDAYQQIQGIWIQEIGEIEKWNAHRDQATIKSFLSSRRDRYRPSYGRNMINQKRQCVLAGSTNRDTFLADETGSRRYWPVTVGDLDIKGIRDDRDQLWAEALHRYNQGEPWHLTPEESVQLREASEDYTEIDPLEEDLARWVADPSNRPFELSRAMEALGFDAKTKTKGMAQRVGGVLCRLGYSKSRKTVRGRKVTLWDKPDA